MNDRTKQSRLHNFTSFVRDQKDPNDHGMMLCVSCKKKFHSHRDDMVRDSLHFMSKRCGVPAPSSEQSTDIAIGMDVVIERTG